MSTGNLLEDELKVVVLFKVLDELNDVFMTFAVMEEVDIFEVSPYTVTENFINYLHSILNISEDVDTSLHRSISTSVQHLAGHLMKFMEGIGSN